MQQVDNLFNIVLESGSEIFDSQMYTIFKNEKGYERKNVT